MINVDKGKSKEGYSNCESTKLVSGQPVGDSLKQKYKDNGDYRLPYHPNFADHFKGV